MASYRNLRIIKESDKAFQLKQSIRGSETTEWIPKSQLDYIKKHPRNPDGSQDCDITIPDWLAEQKNFIE